MDATLRELTATALELLPQAVVIAEPGGSILSSNAAARQMLGEGAVLGHVLAQSSAALDWQSVLAAMEEGSPLLAHRNVTMSDKAGRQRIVDIHFRRLAGESPAVLVVLTDVSDRLTMERRLAATERLAGLGEVAARVAHELNNPLDGILRFIGLAQRTAGQDAARHLQGAREGLQRMAEIIRDLRQQGGLRAAGTHNSPIERMLEEAIRVMQPRAQALGVTIVCDLAESASQPAEGGLFQVFCNVIKNALDAMPGGGLLNVRLRHADGRVQVEFADTGCGISPHQAEEIFQPFYTTKPPGEGLGLGLTICREILARSGGAITAAPREGGGASILIQLPIPSPPRPA